MADTNKFKERLKELRKEYSLTQQELADKIGVVRTAIANYETGRTIPDADTLSLLAKIFNTTTDYLLGNSDIRNPYKMVNRQKLAQLIIELRNKKGYSQRKLAMVSEVSNSTISRIESATSDADPETLRKLAPYLGISYETLMEAAGYIESESNKEYIESKGEQNQLPDSFETPEEAVKFLLEQNVIMGFGGFDIDKLSDEEKVEFANELLHQLKLLSYKYKK